jgi:hypothetical protein
MTFRCDICGIFVSGPQPNPASQRCGKCATAKAIDDVLKRVRSQPNYYPHGACTKCGGMLMSKWVEWPQLYSLPRLKRVLWCSRCEREPRPPGIVSFVIVWLIVLILMGLLTGDWQPVRVLALNAIFVSGVVLAATAPVILRHLRLLAKPTSALKLGLRLLLYPASGVAISIGLMWLLSTSELGWARDDSLRRIIAGTFALPPLFLGVWAAVWPRKDAEPGAAADGGGM